MEFCQLLKHKRKKSIWKCWRFQFGVSTWVNLQKIPIHDFRIFGLILGTINSIFSVLNLLTSPIKSKSMTCLYWLLAEISPILLRHSQKAALGGFPIEKSLIFVWRPSEGVSSAWMSLKKALKTQNNQPNLCEGKKLTHSIQHEFHHFSYLQTCKSFLFIELVRYISAHKVARFGIFQQ